MFWCWKKRAVTVIITEQRRGGCHTGKDVERVCELVHTRFCKLILWEFSSKPNFVIYIDIDIDTHFQFASDATDIYWNMVRPMWKLFEQHVQNQGNLFSQSLKRPFDVLYQNVLTGENKHVVCSQRQKKIITVWWEFMFIMLITY